MNPSTQNLFISFIILIEMMCIPSNVLGQNQQTRQADIDHLLQSLRQLRSEQRSSIVQSESFPGKCGLGRTFEVIRNWNTFSDKEKREVQEILAPPERQKNRTIGKFQIFYDTVASSSGNHVPSLLDINNQPIPGTVEQYVDSTGKYFNDVWRFEIDSLGYVAPPLESNGLYRVCISDLGVGLYGQTVVDPPIPISGENPPRFKTYIEIDKSFRFVYASSKGIPGLKVTAAHEFHHAIQLGSYGSWDSDRYFYEITSTWMEDVVYPNVNDYYQYLSNDPRRSSQFSYPDVRFTQSDGSIEYSRSVWGKFLEKRFTRDLMRQVWENIRLVSTLPAMNQTLIGFGSSFRAAFLEFAYWNSSTGPNADTVRFYSEGKKYPLIRSRSVVEYMPPQRSFADSLQAVGSVYHPILVDGDPMLTIISNINTETAMLDRYYSFVYEMAEHGNDGFRKLANNIYVRLAVPDPEHWNSRETVPTVVNDVVVYPSPFYTGRSSSLKFRLPFTNQPTAVLSVFSSSLDNVFSAEVPVIVSSSLEPRIEWNAADHRGEPVGTGVYLYLITLGSDEFKGKFTIIRE